MKLLEEWLTACEHLRIKRVLYPTLMEDMRETIRYALSRSLSRLWCSTSAATTITCLICAISSRLCTVCNLEPESVDYFPCCNLLDSLLSSPCHEYFCCCTAICLMRISSISTHSTGTGLRRRSKKESPFSLYHNSTIETLR